MILMSIAAYIIFFVIWLISVYVAYKIGSEESKTANNVFYNFETIVSDVNDEQNQYQNIRFNQSKRNQTYQKGFNFEDFVISLFPDEGFGLVNRAYGTDPTTGRTLESCTNPDLKFRDKQTNDYFWIECKYRHTLNTDGTLNWCTEEQLKRYKNVRKNTGKKVFIVIGLGGNELHPNHICLLDLDDIYYTTLFKSTYFKNVINNNPFESLEDLRYRHELCLQK